MPKRKDIKKILVVGAGPIIIGQACEFDYSGTQACKALKDEGYKVVLINSNPATIMTDPDVADKTYIEPITLDVLGKILKKEKPDAILPTMGGQTALNLAMEAEKKGILKKYKIELIGANSKAISNAEDRKKFRKNMIDIGLDLPKSEIVNNNNQASKVLKKIGLPAIIRPAFTLGGLGGGIAKTKKDYLKIIKDLIKKNLPIFGICLGHQILALALGGKTKKMKLGHRGANHPVKNLIHDNVEITSQNHGFEVVKETLPKNIEVTHKSLFDNSIEGIKLKNKPVFSVQYHPESNPGPQDSVYLFQEFINNMKKNAKKKRY